MGTATASAETCREKSEQTPQAWQQVEPIRHWCGRYVFREENWQRPKDGRQCCPQGRCPGCSPCRGTAVVMPGSFSISPKIRSIFIYYIILTLLCTLNLCK